MKAISKFTVVAVLFASLVGVGSVLSQEVEPAFGVFTLVNCSSLPGVVVIKVDDAIYRPKGYRPGDYSQGGQLAEGTHSISAECEGAKPVAQTVSVRKGASAVLIVYSVLEIKPDGTSETVLKLTQYPDKPKRTGFHYTGLYVSGRPSAALYVDKQPVTFQSMLPLEIPAKGHLRVSTQAPVPGEQENRQTPDSLKFSPEEQGDYLLLVFDDPSGKLKFRLVYNTLE